MFAIGLTLWGTWLARRHFRSTPPRLDTPFALFPVSILKPLKGVDAGSEENLESFFRLNYPDFELLFSVADAHDPAARTVRQLMAKYPGVKSRLIVGAIDIGPNPKVNNMVKSYEQASNDFVLISDSNVRVPTDYLKRLVAHWGPDVGLVTAIVAGRSPDGAGGLLEATFLNTFYARGMFMAWAVGRPSVIGKSMLFRRSDAARFGGIRALGCYLAEDYMAGEAFRHLGRKVVLATDPVHQHIGEHTLQAFWSRHLRWGRIRKAQAPLIFAIEPPFGAITSGLIGAWAALHTLAIAPAAFLTIHLTLWSACDYFLLRKLGGKADFRWPILWFAREFLSLPLWAHIASGNTVNWRGRKLRLLSGGVLEGALEQAR
jgi:ceramide glucosyltransferase